MAQSSAGRKARTGHRGSAGTQQAVITLLSAADRVRGVLEAAIGPHGITGQQYNVLRILRGAGPKGLPTLAIAERLIERAPGITRMLDRLERQTLIARERRAGDRRCVHCRLTPRGLELLAKLDEPVAGANREALSALRPADVVQLATLLERVRRSHEPDDDAEARA